MWHTQTANFGEVKVQRFPIPENQKEFDALTVAQKTVLLQQYPESYHRFARPKERKPWEK